MVGKYTLICALEIQKIHMVVHIFSGFALVRELRDFSEISRGGGGVEKEGGSQLFVSFFFVSLEYCTLKSLQHFSFNSVRWGGGGGVHDILGQAQGEGYQSSLPLQGWVT